MFENAGDGSAVPLTELSDSVIGEGIPIADLIIKASIAPPKSEPRRLIIQGGISVNDKRISDPTHIITAEERKAPGQE